MGFDFSTSNRILFGNGTLQQAGGLAFNLGRRALLVTGKGGADPASLIASLEAAEVSWDQFSITGEPDLDTASAGIQAGRSFNADLVIGFGGGSSLDAAKAIAALVTNPGEPLDYLEVVGRGQPLTQLPLPVLAIPTTAGTGSEVTRNAVLSVPKDHVKVSLRHPAMLPRLALVDPQLTISLPPHVTASTGMDALTQLIEPYVSTRANEMTDLFCLEGMRRAATSLVKVVENGNSLPARTDMAYASLLGGMALANAGLGAVHGLAAPIGGMFKAPHGALCAYLLPLVFRLNYQLLQKLDQPASLARFEKVGQILLGNANAGAREAIQWLFDLRTHLKIPSLSSYGITFNDLPQIADAGLQASSMKPNPVKLTQSQLVDLLSDAL
jgi:alcohol dehydrogenase class IV